MLRARRNDLPHSSGVLMAPGVPSGAPTQLEERDTPNGGSAPRINKALRGPQDISLVLAQGQPELNRGRAAR